MQTTLVIITFLIACTYLGNQLYKTFGSKDGHCEGCAASPIHPKNIKKSKAKI